MGQLRRIQRAQRSRAGDLVSSMPKIAPIDRNVIAAFASGQPEEERLLHVWKYSEEAYAYEPKLPKRVAAFGYALLLTFLAAWAFAALLEVSR